MRVCWMAAFREEAAQIVSLMCEWKQFSEVRSWVDALMHYWGVDAEEKGGLMGG